MWCWVQGLPHFCCRVDRDQLGGQEYWDDVAPVDPRFVGCILFSLCVEVKLNFLIC